MATAFRGHIVRLWITEIGGTLSNKAAVLTEAAIKLGFITRTRPVPGTALKAWFSEPENTPLWAAQTALTLMLNRGWTPKNNQDWCGMSSLLFRANSTLSLDDLIALLPNDIDSRTAAGWFVAAIEEDAHYRSNKKSK